MGLLRAINKLSLLRKFILLESFITVKLKILYTFLLKRHQSIVIQQQNFFIQITLNEKI